MGRQISRVAKGSTTYQVLSRIRQRGGAISPELVRDASAQVAAIRGNADLDMAGKQEALRQIVRDGLPTEQHQDAIRTKGLRRLFQTLLTAADRDHVHARQLAPQHEGIPGDARPQHGDLLATQIRETP